MKKCYSKDKRTYLFRPNNKYVFNCVHFNLGLIHNKLLQNNKNLSHSIVFVEQQVKLQVELMKSNWEVIRIFL